MYTVTLYNLAILSPLKFKDIFSDSSILILYVHIMGLVLQLVQASIYYLVLTRYSAIFPYIASHFEAILLLCIQFAKISLLGGKSPLWPWDEAYMFEFQTRAGGEINR